LAILTKESAAVLPALLVVLDAVLQGTRVRALGGYLRRRGFVLTCMGLVLVAALWARVLVLGGVVAVSHPLGAGVLREIPRIWTATRAWPHYVRLLFVPWQLSSDYSPHLIEIAYGWNADGIFGAILVLGVLAGAWAAERLGTPLRSSPTSPRILSAAVLWVAISLLPVANLLYLAPVLLAERTLYLPSVGAVAALSWCLVELGRKRRRMAGAAAIALVLAGTVRTIARVPVWADTESVSATLLEEHPESGRAWYGLALQLAAEGSDEAALRAFGVALELLDSDYQLALDVASFQSDQGRGASARFFLERAWREYPSRDSAPARLATLELLEGRPAAAESAARAVIQLSPEAAVAYFSLADALRAQNRPAEAARARRDFIRLGFSDQLGAWLELAGDLRAAADSSGLRAALDSARARATTAEDQDRVNGWLGTDSIRPGEREPGPGSD